MSPLHAGHSSGNSSPTRALSFASAIECVLLPVANTTAEWIARWIGGELIAALAAAGAPPAGRVRVEVDECAGQSAVWERIPG
ncbi:MAG: hypothetical protein WCJ21_04980 [Planctomycetota bacterium]